MKTVKNETHQHILDVGRKLIATRGFSSVGLSEVLKIAQVPKGSFYYYFKSKEQFGEELIKNYFSQYLVGLEEILKKDKRSAFKRLLTYWQLWHDTQIDECSDNKCLVVKLSAEVSDLSEPMRLALLEGSSMVIDQISKCIEEGIGDGSISEVNSHTTAELLYHMWLGASLMSKLHHSAGPLSRALVTTKTILVQNI